MKLEFTYNQYSLDVLSGKIVASNTIRLACQRFEQFKLKYEFREKKVKHVINFIFQLKHFSGKVNGLNFLLMPWLQFIVANIYGFYYPGTNKRVTELVYILIGRKAGKTSLISALCLYALIGDGEAGSEVDCLATSREQAAILFEMSRNYISGVDPKEKIVKRYRNQLKFPATKSVMNVLASDSMRQDGKSPYLFVCDEIAAYTDSALYDVMKSGQGFRENPLAICISSPGFLLGGYFCYDYRTTCIEILQGLKEDDSQFSAIYELDPDDDWTDESVWLKSNPNLGQTVTLDWLRALVKTAINNPTQQVSVKTKNLGIFCQSSEVWIPDEIIRKASKKVDLKQFNDCVGFMGVDLAAVSDLTALTVMIPQDYKFYYKTFYYLPQETIYNSPNSDKYREWQRLGYLTVTPGNVTDYQYIINDMVKIQEEFGILIEQVGYDSYNATQWAVESTNLGFNMCPVSQSIGNFNRTTKEMERLLKLGDKVIIDNNPITRWCFLNVGIKVDLNENMKPIKVSANQKIDGVISMLQALQCYLNCPLYSFEI